MKVLLLMDANQVNLHTAKSFVQFLTAVVRKFSKYGLKDSVLKQLIHPYFVNFANVTHRELFEDQLRSILKTFEDK